MTSRSWEHLLSLGSNVEPDHWIPRALALFDTRFGDITTSPRYAVPAVGGAAGTPDFVNLAVRVRTDLPPQALRVVCRHVEELCARVRSADRNAPRTLDVDVVYSLGPGRDPVAADDLATEPYVLVPCADIWPDAGLPETSVTLAERVDEMVSDWRAAHVREG